MKENSNFSPQFMFCVAMIGIVCAKIYLKTIYKVKRVVCVILAWKGTV